MAWVNGNYAALQDSYLFSQVAYKVAAFAAAHPEKKIIRLGIGDVTLPLAPAVVEAMQKAVAEMGVKETFRGYGPEQGYDFLHEALVSYYAGFGVKLESSEIFISDGAKSDCGNITDIFDDANVILVPDPVYPVYLDTNIMRGRQIIFMKGSPSNDFLPMPDPSVKADIIYLCSPNNPTGAAYSKTQLEAWVAYAKKQDAIILYDAAYEAFIVDKNLPRSIFLIEGAKECAIELCSFSKTAGFTGTRCGYT
ncbi:MAG: LL-diaminopimelate aminotransferase, partial [Acidaminococcaceae bacterium]|nr:LL-diaminopimelate aminotransferase [Acidaminococcaceae bacterium]